MTVSRRSFLSRSLKLVAVAVAAPFALKISAATAVKEVVAAPVQEPVFKCSDYSPQITIQVHEYNLRAPIKYQELGKYPSCGTCEWVDKCTAEGCRFVSAGLTDMEVWSKKLTRKWYEQSFLGKMT